jgi:tRNA pseudouridine55 synthase
VDDGALREALSRFTGDIMQIPPMYSAVKIGGKRMYELARRGIEADRPPRPITIHRLELVGVVGEDYILRVTCSKGTYVRTLCADIGDFLGCGAVMSSLRRTRVGAFGILTARELDAVVSAGERGEAEDMLFPVDSLFESFPAAVANPVCEHRCKSGAHYPCPDLPDGRYRVYSQSGEFLMLGDAKSGRMNIGKTFFNLRSRNND